MVLGIYFVNNACDDTLLVNNESLAQGADTGFATHLLLSPCAESLQHLGGRVGEQREGQFVFAMEIGMGFYGIFADAIHFVTLRQEGLVVIPQVACVGCASGGGVRRIEIEDSFAATNRFVGYEIAVLVLYGKRRNTVADSHNDIELLII